MYEIEDWAKEPITVSNEALEKVKKADKDKRINTYAQRQQLVDHINRAADKLMYPLTNSTYEQIKPDLGSIASGVPILARKTDIDINSIEEDLAVCRRFGEGGDFDEDIDELDRYDVEDITNAINDALSNILDAIKDRTQEDITNALKDRMI